MTKKHSYREGAVDGICVDCSLPEKHQCHGRVKLAETTNRGPEERFEALKLDEGAPGRIFARLTQGDVKDFPKQSLPTIARELGVPKGAFVEWFLTEHSGLYDTALKVIAADLALQAMEAAMDATPEDVQVRRLQADVALKLASRFDRARYGDQTMTVKSALIVGGDAGLLGEAGALLARLSAPKIEKVVATSTTYEHDAS